MPTHLDHICGVFTSVKRSGCCTCCDELIYEERETYTEGPLAGYPRRLGGMLEHGCQVTLLLSDGSTADVSFCLDCAQALTPAHYQALWRCCADRQELSLQLAGRSTNERRVARASFMATFPVAVVGRRRESEPGVLAVDRR